MASATWADMLKMKAPTGPIDASKINVGQPPSQTQLNVATQQQPPVPGAVPLQVGPDGQLPFGFTPYDQKDEYKQKLADYGANRARAVEQQQAGIKDYEKLLQDHLQRSGQGASLDLSPLMALTDEWTGSNLARSYQRPTDYKGVLETTAALQQGLQKARGQLTDDEAQRYLSEMGLMQKADQTKADLLLGAAKLKEAQAGTDANKAYKDEKINLEAKDKYNKEFGKVIRGSATFLTSANKVKEIIARNGGRIPTVGTDAGLLRSEVGGMMANYNRYVAELGALSGPDADIIESKIGVSVRALPNLMRDTQGGGAATLQVLNSITGNMQATHARTKEIVNTLYNGRVNDALAIDDQTFNMAVKGQLYKPQGAVKDPSEMTEEELKAELGM